MISFNRNIAHGMSIKREDNNSISFHTIDDLGLAIVNTDYISEPEQETTLIDVPFLNGYVDASEAVAGRPTYKKRIISVKLKGFRERKNWDSVISDLRNKVHGRVCQITFDNDREYYWRGRVYIEDYTRAKECGYFTINIPEADPYKYSVKSSVDTWLWDTFNFLTDSVTIAEEIEVNGTKTYRVARGNMYTAPTFVCRNATNLKVTDGTTQIDLINGSNYDPRIEVNGDEDVTLTFTGAGFISLVYRGGSL